MFYYCFARDLMCIMLTDKSNIDPHCTHQGAAHHSL